MRDNIPQGVVAAGKVSIGKRSGKLPRAAHRSTVKYHKVIFGSSEDDLEEQLEFKRGGEKRKQGLFRGKMFKVECNDKNASKTSLVTRL